MINKNLIEIKEDVLVFQMIHLLQKYFILMNNNEEEYSI